MTVLGIIVINVLPTIFTSLVVAAIYGSHEYAKGVRDTEKRYRDNAS